MGYGHLAAARIGHPDGPLLVAVGRNTCWHAPSAEMGREVASGRNAWKFMRFFACVMNMDPCGSIGNATLPLGGLVCMQYADTCMQHAPCSRMTRARFSMQLVHVKHEMHSTWSHEKIPDKIGWRKPPFGMRMRRHVHSCRMTHATSRIHVFFAWEKKASANDEYDPKVWWREPPFGPSKAGMPPQPLPER